MRFHSGQYLASMSPLHRLGRNGPALTCGISHKIRRVIFDSNSQFQKKKSQRLPMRQCSFAGEFAQCLCQGVSLSGIAVLFRLLNRALGGCANLDFSFSDQTTQRQAKTCQHKYRGTRQGYHGFITTRVQMRGWTEEFWRVI